MTNEIKEILYLEKYIDKYKSDEKSIINGNRLTTPAMLDYLEVKALLDYITNLQKTQETLIKNDNEIITNLQEENEKNKNYSDFYKDMSDKWKNMSDMFKKSCEDYKQRIDKAVEYCNNNIEFTPRLLDIIDILRGDE